MTRLSLRAAAALVIFAAPSLASAQAAFELDSQTVAGFRWRNVGPANMMGRVSDVVGLPSPSKTFFVAAAAGGIWKSINNGVTWRPVFDNQNVVSMGMLAIAPSDSMQVWAGSGEPNSRNSISPGGGIFKSTDGGLTWKAMGLEKTQTIGRIVVHPNNPNVVYVAALGAIWNANPERGLYKTEDGGTTWKLVKFVSDKAGFVDVHLDPSNPNTVWAASYQRVRGPYFLNSGGPGSALWKSTDAGANWVEVKGGGMPETAKGRIGIAISASNPRVMYTMVEADTVANPRGEKGKPAAKSPSGLYRSEDAGVTWTKTSDANVRPFYYSQVRVHPKKPDRVYWSSTPVLVSDDGGKTARNATQGIHVDHHGMWIDPVDPDRMIVGNDGGVGITFDQGGTYAYPANITLGQFYNLSHDFQVPYRVCGGLQDNGSWCGPSRRKAGAITNAMWFTYAGGDGFVTAQDPTDANIIYAESQGGNITRVNVATGQSFFLQKPAFRRQYAMFEDSILIARGDTTVRPTAEQARRIAELRARQRTDSIALDMRFNWNTPFFISWHNPATIYAAGNRVLKSTKRGDEFFAISPDLSYADTMKLRISTKATGGITLDATGAETYGTIVSLNESPVRAGILYAGTDDGRVWMSRNDGGTWEELTSRFAGVPAHSSVSRIEPSSHDSMSVFVTFDNHRTGDFLPYVYMSSDYGRTFRSIAANLPRTGPGFAHVIRQDPANANVLYVGTDAGAYVSMNKGQSWQRFMTGLPTVPVHDLRIHPRDRELMAATHGRGIWIVDVGALQQMNATVVASDAHLFTSPTAYQFGDSPFEGQSPGHMLFEGTNVPYGAVITYRLAARAPGPVRVVVTDAAGDTIQSLTGPGAPGINRVAWAFAGKPAARAAMGAVQKRDSALQMNRVSHVLDSLSKSGGNPMMIGMIRGLATTGDLTPLMALFGGGRGAAGFGAPPVFNPRPGEGAVIGGGRGGAAGGSAPDPNAFMAQLALLAIPGRPIPSGFQALNFLENLGFSLNFGGGGAGEVSPGDYMVSVTTGGKTMRQKVRVERAVPGASIR